MPGTCHYFGADGGGTKTLGLLTDAQGRELARAKGGATNPNVVGVEESARQLAGLLRDCCTKGGVEPASLAGVIFGLAGAGNPLIQERLIAALHEEARKGGYALPPAGIQTDARIALEGAFAGGPGIIVIAGTGSAILGKTPEGEIRLIGGWGRTLGDDGSGYFVGVEGLKAIAAMIDGRRASTPLRTLMEQRFGFDSRGKIVNAIYQENFPIPSIAPVVVEAAEGGDGVALDILRRGSDALADQVKALVHASPPLSEGGVVFIGGLIDHPGVPERTLRESIQKLVPSVTVCQPKEEPVVGAVLLAQHAFPPR